MNAFEEEKEYLEYVVDNLKKEEEYYKNEMKEIPRRHTNKLQGDPFLVESLLSTVSTKLKKLELSENKPYFGRIDFLASDSNNVLKIYIGKTTIRDDKNEMITVDWRAPICDLYYNCNTGKASYNSPSGELDGELKLKRQIIINNGKLIDVLETNLITDDELLQPFLDVRAGNKMKTIVESIQKEQNAIIRMPLKRNTIVQGVAGSGKTSVALHRIAYLVFNYEEQVNSKKFLVVGPNNYFLDYISYILPELETEPVEQNTLIGLLNNILNEKIYLDNNTLYNQKQEQEEYMRIQKFKTSLEFKTIIDRFMEDYLVNIVSDGFKIEDELIYSADTVRKILFYKSNSHPDFEGCYRYFLNNFKSNMEEIYYNANRKYKNIYTKIKEKDNEERKEAILKSEQLRSAIRNDGIKLLKTYFKNMRLNILDIYGKLIENIDKYCNCLSDFELKKLKYDTLQCIKKKKISFEDIPAILHIYNLLYYTKQEYSHIVIDEAQDYGLFHFYSLKETFPNCTFSIYGDLGQSIYSYRSIDNWESVSKDIFNNNCLLAHLNKSYRTTVELTINANKVLRKMNYQEAEPVLRHGTEISFNNKSKSNAYKLSKIKEWIDKGYRTIALICKSDREAKSLHGSLKKLGLDIKYIQANNEDYKGNLFVLTSALSKGLEFDAVMLNDASNNIYDHNNINDLHLLYVALTRALHELDILYDKELTPVLLNDKDFDKQKILEKNYN